MFRNTDVYVDDDDRLNHLTATSLQVMGNVEGNYPLNGRTFDVGELVPIIQNDYSDSNIVATKM